MRPIFWVLLAWPLPAVVAGALGWRGIWGSGGALTDFLIPIPVAGGVLHVPSFVICGLIVMAMPSAGEATAGRMRAFLIGMLLAGLLMLLRLDDLLLAWQTQSRHVGSLWQENPLGLFVLSDALMALAFTALASQRPWLRIEIASLLLVLLPIALPLGMVMKYSPAGQPFLPGAGRPGPTRTDAIELVYTSLDVDSAGFRSRAEAYVASMHPRRSINSDDMAVLFTPNLNAARAGDKSAAKATLCLYEDGTPSRFLPGDASAECFESHVSFSERFEQAYAARPAGEPADIKGYMARRAVCAGVKPIGPDGSTGGLELSSMRLCSRLDEARTALRARYPESAAMLDAAP
jgi:hypothetical protein